MNTTGKALGAVVASAVLYTVVAPRRSALIEAHAKAMSQSIRTAMGDGSVRIPGNIVGDSPKSTGVGTYLDSIGKGAEWFGDACYRIFYREVNDEDSISS